MASSTPAGKRGIVKTIPAVISAVIGVVVGRYSGLNLLIPVLGACLCGWLMRKWLPQRAQPMVPAAAVQAGHLLWLGLGLMVLQLTSVLPDILIMAGGLVWLMAWPGLLPVLLLSVFQVVAFGLNLVHFLSAQVGSAAHKGLIVHLILRIVAVILMYTGWRAMRRQAVGVRG